MKYTVHHITLTEIKGTIPVERVALQRIKTERYGEGIFLIVPCLIQYRLVGRTNYAIASVSVIVGFRFFSFIQFTYGVCNGFDLLTDGRCAFKRRASCDITYGKYAAISFMFKCLFMYIDQTVLT